MTYQANRELVLKTPGLIAFWPFQEQAGEPRQSICSGISYPLTERAGPVERVQPADGSPFGEFAGLIEEGQWLELPRKDLGALDIHGKDAQVTVIAWLKRKRKTRTVNRCEAVCGVWDEPRANRQYCLFLNLKVNKNHPGQEILHKVSGHISDIGGPTPGLEWCYDVAQSASDVPFEAWCCGGFTYDGNEIRAYHNGVCEAHEGYNPYAFTNGIYDAGPNGSGFKVGVSDDQHGDVCNWFAGSIGGIAVFNRALTASEMATLAIPTENLLIES